MGTRSGLRRRVAQWLRRAEPPPARSMPPGVDALYERLIQRVDPFTMTTTAELLCLADAVEYIAANKIPGGIVECGVWRGGSMMLAAIRLLDLGDATRGLWLFDTFDGMTPPGDDDRDLFGRLARDVLAAGDSEAELCRARATLDEVKTNLLSTGYPPDLCHFVKGPVEQTVPDAAPAEIAILRLDTDWYQSTKHDLTHLYPRLVPGGILIVDDYGHWRGARKAVDEYVREKGLRVFLNRIDYSGRCVVKPGGPIGR